MATISKNGVWSCYIENLCHWVPAGGGGGAWRRYFSGDSDGLNLRICHDLLLITHCDKCVESLNLASSTMKGFFKGTVIILAISGQKKCIRKIKFELRCDAIVAAECVSKLKQFVPVEDRNTNKSSGKQTPFTFRTVKETLQQILEKGNDDHLPPMPTPYKDFVRLCLLDPAFPQLVVDAEKILNELLMK